MSEVVIVIETQCSLGSSNTGYCAIQIGCDLALSSLDAFPRGAEICDVLEEICCLGCVTERTAIGCKCNGKTSYLAVKILRIN